MADKMVRYSDRADVMSCHKKLLADWIHEILYSLYGCVWCELQVRTHRYIRRLFGSSEGGTRLAMPKTDLRVGYLVFEARFRGY